MHHQENMTPAEEGGRKGWAGESWTTVKSKEGPARLPLVLKPQTAARGGEHGPSSPGVLLCAWHHPPLRGSVSAQPSVDFKARCWVLSATLLKLEVFET